MTSNPSPDSTPDLATPRPWRIAVVQHGIATLTSDLRLPNEALGKPFSLPEHRVAKSISEADAALIVEAVNAYDRLRAIEAAARALLDEPRHKLGREHRDCECPGHVALRAAIQGGSKT